MKILAVCEAEFHLVQTEKVRKSPISSIFFASTSLYLSFFPLVNFVNFVEIVERRNSTNLQIHNSTDSTNSTTSFERGAADYILFILISNKSKSVGKRAATHPYPQNERLRSMQEHRETPRAKSRNLTCCIGKLNMARKC